MFQENFTKIMSELNLTSSTLADYSGINRTTISKYKNGSRIPSKDSPGTLKLIQGICLFVNDSKQEEKLRASLDLKADTVLSQGLYQFLFQEYYPVDADNIHNKELSNRTSFGDRLDIVMTLVNMSNIRLSKLINVDASLISRYRSGIRTPKSNPYLQNSICEILLDRVLILDKLEELSQICKIPVELLNLETLKKWLFSLAEPEQTLINAANQLIYSLDQFSLISSQSSIALDDLLKNYTIDQHKQRYRGYEGLRSAVVRFLLTSIQKKTKDIWLYSDHDISWMTSDTSFQQLWASLMIGCVKNGVHIHIVHNLNRNMSEMISAIKTWIPLYMTGLLDSYYCTQNTSALFSHTLFFNPEIACIESYHVRGMEASGIFNYQTDPDLLAHYSEAFQSFMNNTNPLIRVHQQSPKNIQKTPIVILPEELQVFKTESDAEVIKIPISNNPFKNVKISIGKEYVEVTRLLSPQLTFYLTHPLLCNAFHEYYKALKFAAENEN